MFDPILQASVQDCYVCKLSEDMISVRTPMLQYIACPETDISFWKSYRVHFVNVNMYANWSNC
jgi:hypothetical protein